eukprot:TRINITY_DN1978_c0_g1_i2.p1 TRINITY_DN1978_c0_g1~~TRINITY_DN1978_c0_g1_i2.p1  ORF type:complete len:1050 (-),score=218.93 TRINITY_DN1978_c0_g1_i2:455-3604(-)
MPVRVKLPVAEWLCDMGFIDQVYDLDEHLNTVALDEDDVELLVTGILVAKAAEQYMIQCKQTERRIDLVVATNSQATRNFNWNLLTKELRTIGISITDEMKSLLKSGDADVAADLLFQLHEMREKHLAAVKAEKQAQKKDKKSRNQNAPTKGLPESSTKAPSELENSSDLQRGENGSHENSNAPHTVQPKANGKHSSSKAVDRSVDEFGTELYRAQHISESQNPIEFFTFVASDILGIRHPQAYTLVTSNQARLRDLLVDGFREDFTDSVRLLKDVMSKMVLLARVIDESESPSKSFLYVLSLLSCGLQSQSYDVCVWTGRVIGKMCQLTRDPSVSEAGWQWFENEGYRHVLHSYAKNPQTLSILLPLIDGFCRRHYKKLFCKIMPAELSVVNHMYMCHDLVPILTSQYGAAEVLLSSGTISSLIDICFQHLKADQTEEERLASMTFLTELWIEFQPFVETRSLGKKILSTLRKGCRSSSLNTQMVSLACLFQLLESLYATKDTFCPIIYKSIIFSLIESQPGDIVRHFILSNLQLLIDSLSDIPVGFLVEPLVKQIAMQGYENAEFELFISISRHSTLNARLAIQLLDFFSKIAINDALYGRLATIPMLVILNRFISNEEFMNAVVEFCKGTLTLVFKLEQMKAELIAGDEVVDAEQVMESYHVRRTLILECLAKIVTIRNDNLNRLLQPLFVATQAAFQDSSDATQTPVDPLVRLFKQEPTIIPTAGLKLPAEKVGKQPLSPHQSDRSLPLTEDLDEAFNKARKEEKIVEESDDDSIDELFNMKFPSAAAAWNFPVPDFSAAQQKQRQPESPHIQQAAPRKPMNAQVNAELLSMPTPATYAAAVAAHPSSKSNVLRVNAAYEAIPQPTRIPKPAGQAPVPQGNGNMSYAQAGRVQSQTPESSAFYIPVGRPPKAGPVKSTPPPPPDSERATPSFRAGFVHILCLSCTYLSFGETHQLRCYCRDASQLMIMSFCAFKLSPRIDTLADYYVQLCLALNDASMTFHFLVADGDEIQHYRNQSQASSRRGSSIQDVCCSFVNMIINSLCGN